VNSKLSTLLLSAALYFNQAASEDNHLTTCAGSEESECMNKEANTYNESTDENHYLANWINAEGGFVDSRQEIRSLFPDVPNSPKGVFAKERIEKGDLLLSVPWKLLIRAEMDEEQEIPGDFVDDWRCKLVDNLAREMALGDDSHFAPYVHYLNGQERGQILGDFSHVAQSMLEEITSFTIPSFYLEAQTSAESLRAMCGRDDDIAVHAYVLMEQRSEDDLMIPYYDMYNHRNGRWLNTWINLVDGDRYDVIARHTIEAGQEIFNSYNQCNKCQAKAHSFTSGTPHILDLYGFTESYPQRWAIGEDLYFDIDEEVGTGKLVISWSNMEDVPVEQDVNILENMITTLKDIGERYKTKGMESYPEMTQSEWDTIWSFYDALLVALDHALLSAADFARGGNGYF
jgi:hypothetical protein